MKGSKKLRLAVLCGGRSAERRVSLVSAKTVVDNVDRSRYALSLIFIAPDGRWLLADPAGLTPRVSTHEVDLARGAKPAPHLSPETCDVVFPVLHGPLGEDGTMQGLLEIAGVPYVGCGVLGSALAMDKEYTKIAAQAAGLPVLPWRRADDEAAALKAYGELGPVVFIKPSRMGSSVGVSKVSKRSGVAAAYREARRFDTKVLVEKGIAAREVECAVLGDPLAPGKDGLRASIAGEIVPNAEWYNYNSKYIDPDGAKLLIPAPLTKAQAEGLRALALEAFRALDCYGMGRVDFLMDKKTGKLWFNEINTIPGFTAASMYPLLWKASGLATPRLVDALVACALRRHKARAGLRTAP